MAPRFRTPLLAWVGLLLLGAAEFGVSFLPMSPDARPVIMLFAFAMVFVVAAAFMRVGSGPTILRGFAVAAVFWMILLIGLGSVDPLTRTDYYSPVQSPAVSP